MGRGEGKREGREREETAFEEQRVHKEGECALKGEIERWRKDGRMEGGKGEYTCYLRVMGRRLGRD